LKRRALVHHLRHHPQRAVSLAQQLRPGRLTHPMFLSIRILELHE
jgi:hypothetical protein